MEPETRFTCHYSREVTVCSLLQTPHYLMATVRPEHFPSIPSLPDYTDSSMIQVFCKKNVQHFNLYLFCGRAEAQALVPSCHAFHSFALFLFRCRGLVVCE